MTGTLEGASKVIEAAPYKFSKLVTPEIERRVGRLMMKMRRAEGFEPRDNRRKRSRKPSPRQPLPIPTTEVWSVIAEGPVNAPKICRTLKIGTGRVDRAIAVLMGAGLIQSRRADNGRGLVYEAAK